MALNHVEPTMQISQVLQVEAPPRHSNQADSSTARPVVSKMAVCGVKRKHVSHAVRFACMGGMEITGICRMLMPGAA